MIRVTHGRAFVKRCDCMDRFVYVNVFRRTLWLFGFIPIWTRLWQIGDGEPSPPVRSQA